MVAAGALFTFDMIDYHTHAYRCRLPTGSMEDYVQRALELRLREIGFTDYIDPHFIDVFRPHYEEMCAVRSQTRNGITVRVGVEIDYVPGREDELRRALQPFAFDYVLGGIHFLDEWMIDHAIGTHCDRDEELADVYRRYYEAMQHGAHAGVFDVVAHFDLPGRFGLPAPPETRSIVLQTLDVIRDCGLAIEVSTAGLRTPIAEIGPSIEILQEIRRRHIPIVLSSDADEPSQVGYRFDQLLPLLKDLEFLHLASFQDRHLRPMSLGG